MMTALPTAQPAYGLEGPSAGRTVDNATPQGSTYLTGNSVQSNGAGSHAYFRVLRVLELQPEIPQRELARQLGISMGKANYLVNALLEKGLIKVESFHRTSGKLNKIAYLLTPEGLRNRMLLTRSYLARKEAEYEALKAEIESLRQAQTELAGDGAWAPDRKA